MLSLTLAAAQQCSRLCVAPLWPLWSSCHCHHCSGVIHCVIRCCCCHLWSPCACRPIVFHCAVPSPYHWHRCWHVTLIIVMSLSPLLCHCCSTHQEKSIMRFITIYCHWSLFIAIYHPSCTTCTNRTNGAHSIPPLYIVWNINKGWKCKTILANIFTNSHSDVYYNTSFYLLNYGTSCTSCTFGHL